MAEALPATGGGLEFVWGPGDGQRCLRSPDRCACSWPLEAGTSLTLLQDFEGGVTATDDLGVYSEFHTSNVIFFSLKAV